MEVYLDLVMLMNFMVDLLLLWAANRLSGRPPGGKRTVLAAVLGGVYAGCCLLPGLSFLAEAPWRILSLGIMALLAFGWNASALQRGALFLFLSMALGGLVYMLGRGGAVSVLMSAGILCGLCLAGFRGRGGKREYVSVEITHRGKNVLLTALLDTGNTLRDPVTGCGVLVADADTARQLLGLDEASLRDPVKAISQYPGLRLIPYCAVGQPAGLLLGLKADTLRINGKLSEQIVAFAPQRIGRGAGYEALTGGVL